MNKENVENRKSSSVFEMTKDLMEVDEDDVPHKASGVDWGWGDDHSTSSPKKSAASNDEEEDSDATAEMDSDDDDQSVMIEDEDGQVVRVSKSTPPEVLPEEPAKEDDIASDSSAAERNIPEGNDGEELDSEHTSSPVGSPAKTDATTAPHVETPSPAKLQTALAESENVGENDPFTAEEDDSSTGNLDGQGGGSVDEASTSGSLPKDTEDSEDETKDAKSWASPSSSRRSSRRLRSQSPVEEDAHEESDKGEESDENEADFPAPDAENPDEGSDADDESEKPKSKKVPSPKRTSDDPPVEGTNEVNAPPTLEQPDEDDLFRSTDKLFVGADKDSVTVADICRSIAAEYNCKLNKASKKLVRMRLIDLMKRKVEPQAEEEEDQISEQGDAEESEQSDFEEPDGSDEEYEETKQRPKKKSSKKSNDKKEPKKSKTKKPSARKAAAKAARMVEAERLRKKRMEELRIRNEEMQLNQSKEEQEQAEAIAAKFETNSDELRLKRLEDRLTLLELLDKKRIAVIDALETKIEEKEAAKAEEQATVSSEQAVTVEKEEVEESESSSDEEELDIVGAAKPFKPLKPIHTHLPSKAVNFLKDFRSPQGKRNGSAPAAQAVKPALSPSRFLKSVTSPTKKKAARSNLRQALKQKVRKQGNLWLARELGYQTEEDHLKDCQTAADQKLALVRKLEQARIEANERKLLRERILRQDEVAASDDEQEDEDDPAYKPEEEDEEMQMAKEIEEEARIPNGTEEGKEDSDLKGGSKMESAEYTDDEGLIKSGIETAIGGCGGNDESQDDLKLLETQPHFHTSEGKVSLSNAAGEPVSPETEATDGSVTSQVCIGGAATAPTSTETTAAKGSNADAFADEDDEGEVEFEEEDKESTKDQNRTRNAGWQAMLKKEAEMLKKQKKKGRQGLVEDQAEEEEEEEVAGLEDFGFTIKKKKQDDDEDDDNDDELDEDDLKHVVDDVSDNEGDEEAGEAARKRQERLEEKERHKEIIRRMREGYDGRRGGIAGSGVGARGMHRFDQLVAADNREDAKRLGLLNDDEVDSEDEAENKNEKNADDNEDDEAVLLDKILKDRYLHRPDVDIEENFSEDEEEQDVGEAEAGNDSDAEEERMQERLARRFAKRARMQRLEEEYADSQEFSQQRLIDEDKTMKEELGQMKNGLLRQRTVSSSTRTSSISSQDSKLSGHKRRMDPPPAVPFGEKPASSLSIALRASRKVQRRTTFLGGEKAGKAKDSGALIHKSVALGHVVFASANRSTLGNAAGSKGEKRKRSGPATSSLFQKVARHAQ